MSFALALPGCYIAGFGVVQNDDHASTKLLNLVMRSGLPAYVYMSDGPWKILESAVLKNLIMAAYWKSISGLYPDTGFATHTLFR